MKRRDTTVLCPCCGGAGEHEIRRYATVSPYDRLEECKYCFGDGVVSPQDARAFRRSTCRRLR